MSLLVMITEVVKGWADILNAIAAVISTLVLALRVILWI